MHCSKDSAALLSYQPGTNPSQQSNWASTGLVVLAVSGLMALEQLPHCVGLWLLSDSHASPLALSCQQDGQDAAPAAV